MWLPDRLYRALPYVYTFAGLLLVFTGSWMGSVAGGMLLTAAFIIWKLRKIHRRSRGEQSTQRPG